MSSHTLYLNKTYFTGKKFHFPENYFAVFSDGSSAAVSFPFVSS